MSREDARIVIERMAKYAFGPDYSQIQEGAAQQMRARCVCCVFLRYICSNNFVDLVRYEDFFVDIMMKEELSLPVPTDGDTEEAFRDGCIMFTSFTVFGMLPLLGFILAGVLCVLSLELCDAINRFLHFMQALMATRSRDGRSPGMDTQSLFTVACAITVCSLFGLGAFKAKFHDKKYVWSGIETVVLGGTCAAVAYFVGRAVSKFAGLDEMAFVQAIMAQELAASV